MYQTIQVIEAIPYKSNKEVKRIVDKYHKNSIVKIYDYFVYVEKIELVA